MRPLLILGTLTVLFVAGCSLNTDYFSDYRSKNILGNSGFAVAGKWALTTNTTTSNAAYNPTPTDFMTWTAASSDSSLASAGLTSGPDGSAAYRLEILNLIPDGDFEASGDTGTSFANTTFWTIPYGTTTDVAWVVPSTPTLGAMAINNNTLEFGSTNNIDQLTLTLSSAVNSILWNRAGSYQFRMDFRIGSDSATLPLRLTGATSAQGQGNWDQTGLTLGSTSVHEASESFTVAAGTTPVTLEIANDEAHNLTGNAILAYLDNVRLMNSGIDPTVLLSFSSLSSGTAQLLPGTKSGAYTFSVYVHDDPTATQGASNHSLNRFNPSGLTVKVTAAVKSGTGTYQQFFPRPSGGWTSWTKLTINMGFDFDDSDAQLGGSPALTVKLSPTNTYTDAPDVGSVLVADPVLLYNP